MSKEAGTGAERLSALMMVVVAVIILAGMLFGYDQGVISGALSGIKKSFGLGPTLLEVVTSWVTLGALVGSLIGGELADRIGRKKAVLAAGVLFTLGALLQSIAPDTLVLVGGRLIIGIGVGLAAVAAPLYGAELAPASWRGRFVSAYQLAITIGIFLAYQVDAVLSGEESNWRLMLGAAAVAGIALFLAALAAPESPRWLLKVGRRADALAELRAVRPDADQPALLADMEAALSQEAH
ncbi:MAG TPA: MFS transporter, partial [Acetobacteraceae bacterium]|nr:MFS transporter [Acetobacteraceae bacterium]